MRMIAGIAIVVVLAGLLFVGWAIMTDNVEHPTYAVAVGDGAIEVRDYPALVVAEVARTGERYSAVSEGFRALAGYIFARDRAGPKIAMTAPVIQQETGVGGPSPSGHWKVRFIMPSAYAIETLPRPAGSDVALATLPAGRRAVIRFSGYATDSAIAEKRAELERWIAARGLKANGPPVIAYYNAPWTPGPLRRNEILFDIAG